MTLKVLDPVVLVHDLPEHGLREGDLGTIVEIYEPIGLDVELVVASGETLGVVTLTPKDVRPAGPSDLLAVRPTTRASTA
jgi:hypothetical protein